MGSSVSKNKPNSFEENGRRENMRLLHEEINDTMSKREEESREYEQQAMVFAVKEAEWKRERKRLREEVKRLRKRLEEAEERIGGIMEGEMVVGGRSENEWQMLGTKVLVEHMREEQARRDAAVEKWKRLYLSIKTDLNDLINRAQQGEKMYMAEKEENMMEGLQRELKDKEETIRVLKERLAAIEQEESKKEREMDILRQSLQITSNRKKAISVTKHLSRSLHL
ncbi:hypothetical protein HHK36_026982 [Tetracentron sinense]|uniref:Uncharacterized protein n=1 Tax=Tetracentron sinense TaxID=13715 RepID=A0A834YJN8_TETSI|nr:hypothetical protein HHK36_026982 [Tetracentron sinense]